MINEILLRRKNKVLIDMYEERSDNQRIVATINKNIESLGYTFSRNLFYRLSMLSYEDLRFFYEELIPILKKLRGADVEYNPMYPNFPRQVMEMDEVELYINAIIHYWSEGTLLPYSEKNERLPLFEKGKIEVLNIGTEKDLEEVFVNLLNSKTSWSMQDKEDIKWYYKYKKAQFVDMLPAVFPVKENCFYVCSLLKDKAPQRYFKTATDVLRYATALSGGDISLAQNTRFRNFTRKERRFLLGLLNGCNATAREEEMQKRKEQFIRLGEKLHPGEKRMQLLFPDITVSFEKIRSGTKIETYQGRINKAAEDNDWLRVLELLSQRPGEFARRLAYVIRKTDNSSVVLRSFADVANQVSTPVLLQVRQYFIDGMDKEYRVFFPKGNLAKSYCIQNEQKPISEQTRKLVQQICEDAIRKQYSEKEDMGKVYLSEELKSYIVPFSQRSASKTVRAVTRGSRIKINPDAKVVRGFIWWTNNEGGYKVDLDLSCVVFDESWNRRTWISYTRLKVDSIRGFHSGDIVNGGPVNGQGVAEFIDIDIDEVVKAGYRYVVFNVYSYSEDKFSDLVHARFGWMEREDVQSGEIFEPSTVVQKMDLTSRSVQTIPVIFDCITREFIWCDMIAPGDIGCVNVENTLGKVQSVCYSMTNISKPNIYDLIHLNVEARNGILVDTPEEADFVFDINSGITPYDIDVIVGEYL